MSFLKKNENFSPEPNLRFFRRSHSAFSRSRMTLYFCRSNTDAFFRPRKENTVQSMSNVGEDRIRINAMRFALNTLVGTTVPDHPRDHRRRRGQRVRLEALSATSATVVNSNAIPPNRRALRRKRMLERCYRPGPFARHQRKRRW